MATLIELDLGEGRTLLVETDSEVSVPRSAIGHMGYQRNRPDGEERADLERMQQTLRGFVDGSVAALRDVNADIERVTLEFGVSLGGEAGVPFITKGKSDGAIQVSVQCNLARQRHRLSLDGDS